MAVRFLTGPAVMAAASIAVGLRGTLLHIAIVQVASSLPRLSGHTHTLPIYIYSLPHVLNYKTHLFIFGVIRNIKLINLKYL